MKLSRMLEYNGEIKDLLDDRDLATQIINAAYEHVKVRMSLYPMLAKCTFTSAINLNDTQPFQVGIQTGEIQFKEITDIIGQTLLEEQPQSTVALGSIVPGQLTGYSADIPIYFSHNYIYTEDENEISVPIIGHPFPPIVYERALNQNIPYVTLTGSLLNRRDRLYIPDATLFPLTAKIYALMALEVHNVQVSGAYDGLCNHYINIRNSGLLQITPKEMSKIVGVRPYDLL
ncbi:MAG TPA: hypothetical protein PKI15_08660 [Candidatus Cloacimonadota bacterium]|nr:hypothetical protein [Candidatus Cloacimonadota bacterium]